MSAQGEVVNAAYQEAVDETVGKRPTVRRGYFRLGNYRQPFADPPVALDAIDRAQLFAVFGEAKDSDAQLVDVIDVESGQSVNRLVLYRYGGGTIFVGGTDTCFATITQHGINSSHELPKAWVSSFARAWMLDAASLGLWDGHILFGTLELGEPDDDE